MPAGEDVRPQRWSKILDLYDDGGFSAIWGKYNNSRQRCLGIRWNGNDDEGEIGYPSLGGYPVWFVVPGKFAQMFLLDLYTKTVKNSSCEKTLNILKALEECPKP